MNLRYGRLVSRSGQCGPYFAGHIRGTCDDGLTAVPEAYGPDDPNGGDSGASRSVRLELDAEFFE